MIINEQGRKVAVHADEPSAAYVSGSLLRLASPAEPASEDLTPTRVVVEVQRAFGGMMSRALLGGEFCPSAGRETTFEVLVAIEPLGLGNPATCASSLSKPLVPGLPDEFAQAVIVGLSDSSEQPTLPAGALRIDRAGHDEVNSSSEAFRLAGALLRVVLTAVINGQDVETAAHGAIRAW
ncbi:hypothetical protein OG203_11130 [Nocardia sp. NBC_01499]|uniref:hypothetical protein n=1 Tax=Nocardia sp. NBC_01499 TaxID=2903597 RepID=UPI00386F0F24